MGDNKDKEFSSRLTELKKECDEAKSISEIQECNGNLMNLKARIQRHVSFEAGMNQYSTSALNKLRKDRVVAYCSFVMTLCELSTSNARRLSSEMGKKVDNVKSVSAETGNLSRVEEEVHHLKEENSELKTELLTDKRIIIDLQQQLVSKTDLSVNEVKETVKNELKSYSAVVKSSCLEALAPRKLVSAVKKATVSADEREKNLIVYGLKEKENEDCAKEVGAVLDVVGEKPYIASCSRIGISQEGKVRPVKLTLRSSDLVYLVLKNSNKLKDSDSFSTVYLSRDLTVEERLARKQLVEELKQKKITEPEKTFRINFKEKQIYEVK